MMETKVVSVTQTYVKFPLHFVAPSSQIQNIRRQGNEDFALDPQDYLKMLRKGESYESLGFFLFQNPIQNGCEVKNPESPSVQLCLFTSHPVLPCILTSFSKHYSLVIPSTELSIPYLTRILNFLLVAHISKYCDLKKI